MHVGQTLYRCASREPLSCFACGQPEQVVFVFVFLGFSGCTSGRVRGRRDGGPIWLAEALDTAPSDAGVPALASYSKLCLCGSHSGAGQICKTHSLAGHTSCYLLPKVKGSAGHQATVRQVLVLCHLRRSQGGDRP